MMISNPEYWRINLAVEKVIIKHEFEILHSNLQEYVKDNPFMAIYAACQFASFSATVVARLNKIISDEKERIEKSDFQNKAIHIKGISADEVFTVDHIHKLLN